jgi:hypothetical protein
MKPLNHREINTAFTNFVIAGIITLAIVVFSFYFTNDYLSAAVAQERIEEYSRFQQYKRRQKQYVKRLEGINQSFAGAFPAPQLISDFKLLFNKYGDTSLLMNRIVKLSTDNITLVEKKNVVRNEVAQEKQQLQACMDKFKEQPE